MFAWLQRMAHCSCGAVAADLPYGVVVLAGARHALHHWPRRLAAHVVDGHVAVVQAQRQQVGAAAGPVQRGGTWGGGGGAGCGWCQLQERCKGGGREEQREVAGQWVEGLCKSAARHACAVGVQRGLLPQWCSCRGLHPPALVSKLHSGAVGFLRDHSATMPPPVSPNLKLP